tara:strand:+ start:1820 stop:2014 length:195 start_codon:yes stop_codon:yes gene_type:complete
MSDKVFQSYGIKKNVEEQINAIKILASQGYTIIDLEGHFVNKWNINDLKKPNINYKHTPKLKQH